MNKAEDRLLDDRIGVLLPSKMKEQIKLLADREFIKISDVIRKAIAEYLERRRI